MKETELKIQLYGSPVLARKCKRVEKIDGSIIRDLDDMLELMRRENGIGLAANQAGLDHALVVIELPDAIYRMINPRIIKRHGRTSIEEGCLSFPGLILEVPRAEYVEVEYLDESGNQQKIKADELLAIVLQHEIDHINGITFNRRVPFPRQLEIRSQLDQIKKQYNKTGNNRG